MRGLHRLIGLILIALLFTGCSATSAMTSPTATSSAIAASATTTATTSAMTTGASATATAVAIQTPPPSTTFTCPVTTNGSSNVFRDSATGLSFSYPASWTEASCQRIGKPTDPQQTLFIGNVFSVYVTPRNGLTIEQWVNQQADQNETVTLTPLTVAHAVAAAAVTIKLGPNAGPEEPFIQTIAIVAGSQNFYQVNGLIAQMSVADTMPGESNANLTQQVVTTFNVP